MKSRFTKTLILAAVIVGGIWILSNRDKIQSPGDVVSLIKHKLNAAQAGFSTQPAYQPVYDASGFGPSNSSNPNIQNRPQTQFVNNVVRIASFKLNPSITLKPKALDLIADICRNYDVVALQDIDGRDNTWLARLTDRMNVMGAVGTATVNADAATGKKTSDYFFVSDRSHNAGKPTQSAVVFNRQTLELDQSQWYTVNDPDRMLTRQPLVAWFRTRGPQPDKAFTFSLVNVRIGSKNPKTELAHLSELFRAIRDDGRGEDDVLIVGDFNAGDEQLQPLRKRSGLTWVVSNRPTTTRNRSQFDNLVFNDVATVEFTGRGGVYDFLRKYNMRMDDALEISEHMPVWAEFSVFEGPTARLPVGQAPKQPGRVAETDSLDQR